ncbi:MAG: helix-turn-helix transcriptional regulator [Actinomycetaceae bacterium]|nr:helix-turn-helix transcriptional regulator [Actinomycetaceae bacterium]
MAARSGNGGSPRGDSGETRVTFVISVAAELAGMHPQTLRQYDRLGLVIPERTKGRGRRYTRRHVAQLREIQRLSQEEGINLEGIRRILELQERIERLQDERDALHVRLEEMRQRQDRIFAATPDGEVRPMKRGQRPYSFDEIRLDARQGAQRRDPKGAELALWHPWTLMSTGPVRRVQAVLEAGPSGVRVVEGTVRPV